jgi:choline monooxygenase
MNFTFNIDKDISKAETLPGWFYHDETIFEAMKEKIFARTWQWIGDTNLVKLNGMAHPFSFMEGLLEEPMLLVRNTDDTLLCLSNVCTHRGNRVIDHSGTYHHLMCAYHGRRFDLDGSFRSMPEFTQTKDFPRPCDSLHRFPFQQWGPFLFSAVFPAFSFEPIAAIMQERVGFLPLNEFIFHPTKCKDYLVNANWALYCDNYLEGFHIPFIHRDLNAVLDYGQYSTLLFDHCNLQIGYAKDGEESFILPEGHIDYGKNIGAYYFWIFPNMMFNFYPWGLSINIVKPINTDKTKVSFLTYVYDESKLHSGAGAMLDKVEREDEYVVENVHRGLKSRVYSTGRFSANREQGTHHFHQLLASFLNNNF